MVWVGVLGLRGQGFTWHAAPLLRWKVRRSLNDGRQLAPTISYTGFTGSISFG